MAIDKNDFWDVSDSNRPLLTDEMVKSAEEELGVKLPDLLIDLLRIQNGGYTKGFAFPMTQRTSWSPDHIPFTELYGIVLDSVNQTTQNMMETSYMTDEWGLPEKQVLLTGEGHWWITLDYRESQIPCVRWIDVECNEEVVVAEDFDTFIDGLVPIEKFTPSDER
ncbi:MAG: SMI1/KNR4 family protein [Cyclobacteriaceae bacterium]|nr:SMI1/KNR4 family protein [Cyclobacteriaceae bacterium]